jgi:hypothetical protein
LVDDALQAAWCWSNNAGTFCTVLEEEERWAGLDMVLNGDLGLLFDIKFGKAQSALVLYAQLLV